MVDVNCQPWPLDPRCLPDDWDPDDLTDEQAEAVARASSWLRAATGGKWGPCTISRRFCPPEASARCAPGPCQCGTLCAVELEWPASGPVSFIVDGFLERVPWEIIEHSTLVRTDGRCWPACADLMITFTHGWKVEAGDPASTAMTRLAIWLDLNPCPDVPCGAPPANATQVTRDGWTLDLDADASIWAIWGSWTGLQNVDAWIRAATWVPPITVYNPDAPIAGGVAVTDSGR
jgi:hypothetical protein